MSSFLFNNFLRFFTEGYLELVLSSLLNVAAFVKFPEDYTLPEYISTALACMFLITCILFPLFSGVLMYDKRKELMGK